MPCGHFFLEVVLALHEVTVAVTLVDAHHHLWNLGLNYYPWLTDKPDSNFFLGPIDALKRNYLPEDYIRDSRKHNVLTTVHVEAEMCRVRTSAGARAELAGSTDGCAHRGGGGRTAQCAFGLVGN